MSEGCEYGSKQSITQEACLPHVELLVFSVFFYLYSGWKVKKEAALYKKLPQLIFVNAIESSIRLLVHVNYLLSYLEMFILS